jgi:hypothetical protein
MRYRFDNVFQRNSNGTLTPLRPLQVNTITLGTGTQVGPGVNLGGVNFFEYQNRDIEADEAGDTLVLRGFYP